MLKNTFDDNVKHDAFANFKLVNVSRALPSKVDEYQA